MTRVRAQVPCACFESRIRRVAERMQPFDDHDVEVVVDCDGIAYPEEILGTLDVLASNDIEERRIRYEVAHGIEAWLVGHLVRVVENGEAAGDGDADDCYVGREGVFVGYDSGLYNVEFDFDDFEGFCGFQLSITACPGELTG